MSRQRVVLIATFAVATLSGLCLAMPASASVLFRNGRFVFDSLTAGNKDPVNVILAGGGADSGDGGACLQPNGRTLRSPRCFRTLVEGSWTDGHMRIRPCNGEDSLTFRTPAPKTRPHSDEKISTSDTCKKQFHLRMWGDYYINGGLGHESWTVGVIYHENREPGDVGKGSHHIDRPWEDAERSLIQQLSDFKGYNNDPLGSRPLCTQTDWKVMAGQRPGKYRRGTQDGGGWYNDGRISRISAHHSTGGPNGGCAHQ